LNAGIVTANYFYGDGSGLTGIVAAGSGITVQDNDANKGWKYLLLILEII
jgi:hypothetical protein